MIVRSHVVYVFCIASAIFGIIFSSTLVFSKQKPACIGSHGFRFYRDGKIVEDDVPMWLGSQILYSPLVRPILPLFKAEWISNVYEYYMSHSGSIEDAKAMIRRNAIDMQDYEKAIDQYSSFNEFFTRKLKPSVRKIDQSLDVLVSPADSKCFGVPDVDVVDTFFIKGHSFSLKKLLGNAVLADEYKGGTILIFRLSPYDYHRYHFPLDCVAFGYNEIGTGLDSVNPIAYQAGKQPLLTNKRHIIKMRSERFGDFVMVSVGALLVGKIIETYTPGKACRKGDECGYFTPGASTIALLFKRGTCTVNEDIVAHSIDEDLETAVKMGERVGIMHSVKKRVEPKK